MYTIKGGWVGQTFALAKRNESDGRKTRIRRSKEERKAMVETFIKKYQRSNNGDFPSLNLTHKEVGGSFYTVREIVRDIIQENRVLGPAKFTPEEQRTDPHWEQDPLDSIATDIQAPLTWPCENSIEHYSFQGERDKMLIVSDQSSAQTGHEMVGSENLIYAYNNVNSMSDNLQGSSDEKVVVSDGNCAETGHQFVDSENVINAFEDDFASESTESKSDGMHLASNVDTFRTELEMIDGLPIINDCQVHPSNVEYNEKSRELHITESLAQKMDLDQKFPGSRTTVTPMMADVIVETFPLRPISQNPNSLEERQGVSLGDLEKLSEHQNGKVEGLCVMKTSQFSNEKIEGNLPGTLGKISDLGTEEANKNAEDPLLESIKYSTCTEHVGDELGSLDSAVGSHLDNIITSKTFEQSQVNTGAEQAINNSNDLHTENLDATYNGELKPRDEFDVQISCSSMRKSNPTLDRINLESWEGVPKNPEKPVGNPFLAFLKAFVDAFVKFWSE